MNDSISQEIAGRYEPVKEHPHPTGMPGVQRLYRFANGYGASVVQFTMLGGLSGGDSWSGSYGAGAGLWELAVIRWTSDNGFHLTYDTPITEDVVGYLSEAEVQDHLRQVEALPAAATS